MPKWIHVAIGSTTSKPGDLEGNLRQIEDFANQAKSDGADLLLTPEMSASGYGGYPQVMATAEVAGEGPIYRELTRIAKQTGVVIAAGFVNRIGEKRHIAHFIVWPDGKFIVQNKHCATPAERPLDPFVELGPPYGLDGCGQPCDASQLKLQSFDVKGVRCALTICADSGLADRPKVLDKQGVELWLLAAGAGGRRADRVTTADLMTPEGRKRYSEILETVFFPKWAIEECLAHRRAHAAINQCGFDGLNQYHVGHGAIVNPMGEVVALLHGFPNIDRQRPAYAHARIDVLDRLPI